MKYCKRCLYPENHPLGITFDKEGVCSGCRIHEEKDIINWKDKEKDLKKILVEFRNNDNKNYDCIIPVSGARDSYFVVYMIKNVYKMHPLLVTYNKHYNTKLGIRNLAYLKTIFGCDLLTLTISPENVKKITRATIKKMGSIYWHCIAGQTVFPVQVAVRFKIPLIIWGAHQGIDQVGMFSHLDKVEMTRKYRKDHDLMGFEAEDLIGVDGLNDSDINALKYPHDKEIEKVGVRGIYLNNYIRWDSKKQHETMIKKYKYETAEQRRTFDTYNDVDCFNYSNLHDYIKLIKCGYGKVTDHASREIRLKRMTREEGIEMVKKYQNLAPLENHLNLFLTWIGMGKNEFLSHIERKRNLEVWKKEGKKRFLKDTIINHIYEEGVKNVRFAKKESCNFVINNRKKPSEKEDKYVLIGRGWVDKTK